jgi:cytochrome c peroxidase
MSRTALSDHNGHLAEGASKTPGLRGVALRPPYTHAGQTATLSEVVDHYSEAPRAPIGYSELRPLDLSEREKAALRAFLGTLNPSKME